MSSPEDVMGDAVERLEFDERAEDDTPGKKLRQVTRRTALTGGAAGIAALACRPGWIERQQQQQRHRHGERGEQQSSAASEQLRRAIFGVSSTYKFTMVNHVTTNPFFTPTQSGASDACKLLGCTYQWTGSATSNVSEMVNAFNSAVTAKVDGIGVALISATAFNAPVKKALAAGIPVVSYNADEPQTGRLAYIGQDLFVSGQQMGEHIVSLLPNGGEIALFIATPGSANIQPRIDGAKDTLKSHPNIKYDVVATGAAAGAELTAINQWAQAHASAKGMFAVDAGSTQALAQTIQKQGLKNKGWVGGGYDLTPVTEQLLAAGYIEFTIDQQPYLQGFFPILELYLYKASQGLTGRRRRRHRTEVPGQDDRGAVQQHQEPLRGHERLARRSEELADDRRLAVRRNRHRAASGTDRRSVPGRAVGLLGRFLTLREGSIIVVTLITIVYFSVTTSHFLTGANFKTILPYFAPLAIIAAGEVFVMTLGEIDLSIGGMYLFAPILYWKLAGPLPLVPAVIVSLVIAGLLGAFNGFMTAYVGIASFVATLGMLFALDGASLIISHSEQITTPGTEIVGVPTFAQIFGAGTYSEIIWAIVIVIVLQVLLSFTRWGLYTVSVGGDKLRAAEAGVNTRLVLMRNFVLCAITAGLTGILEAVRTSSITPDPSGSNTVLLQAIAAVIIGGTLMTGGSGTVVGALLGALFLGVLTDGLIIKGVSANYQDLYLGLAILVAMTINVYVQRVRKGSVRG